MARRRGAAKPVDGTESWFRDGLRFECQQDCGACCTRHDDYGYVYLEPDDVATLAEHLGIARDAFLERWTAEEDGFTILVMGETACPFLDGSRCTVYEARPTQCQTFPFWKENIATRDRWVSLATFCPGIGRGEIVPAPRIRSLARKRSVEGR